MVKIAGQNFSTKSFPWFVPIGTQRHTPVTTFVSFYRPIFQFLKPRSKKRWNFISRFYDSFWQYCLAARKWAAEKYSNEFSDDTIAWAGIRFRNRFGIPFATVTTFRVVAMHRSNLILIYISRKWFSSGRYFIYFLPGKLHLQASWKTMRRWQ